MGVVEKIQCIACGEKRPVHASAVNNLDASLIPLSSERVVNVVLASDMDVLVRMHICGPTGMAAGHAVRLYAETGIPPPENALRPLLQAAITAGATALPILRGCTMPCDICGLNPKRLGLDADMKAVRMDTAGGGKNEHIIPGGVVVPSTMAAAVEAAAQASAPSEKDIAGCGETYWQAASVKGGGKRRPLGVTGVAVLACTHRCVFAAAPMTRGEVYSMHVLGLQLAAVLGANHFSHDIACLVRRHIQAQTVLDPSFANPILSAITGDYFSSARLIVPELGGGVAAPLRISLQRDEDVQLRVMSSETPVSQPSPLEMPAPPAGYRGFMDALLDASNARGGVHARVQTAVPLLHAFAHKCEKTFGATNVVGSGWRGEFNEQLFSILSKFAPYLVSLGPAQFRVALDSFFALHNQRQNRDAPERLLRDYVRLLVKVEQQETSARTAREAYSRLHPDEGEITDAVISAWAADQSRDADQVAAGSGLTDDAVYFKHLRAMTRIGRVRDALARVIHLAEATSAMRSARARRGPCTAYAADTFAAAVAEDDTLRSYLARSPLERSGDETTIVAARARLEVLDRKFAEKQSVISRSTCSADSLIKELMGRARSLAASLAHLTPSVDNPIARGRDGRSIARRSKYGVVRRELSNVLDRLAVIMPVSSLPLVREYELPTVDSIKSAADLPANIDTLVFTTDVPERSDVVEADARLTRMLEELRFVQDDALRGAAMCTARLRELQEQYAGLSLISVDPTIDGSHDAADDAALLERALIRGAGRSGLACPPLADGTPEKLSLFDIRGIRRRVCTDRALAVGMAVEVRAAIKKHEARIKQFTIVTECIAWLNTRMQGQAITVDSIGRALASRHVPRCIRGDISAEDFSAFAFDASTAADHDVDAADSDMDEDECDEAGDEDSGDIEDDDENVEIRTRNDDSSDSDTSDSACVAGTISAGRDPPADVLSRRH